jgi:hypothetical protein
MRNSLSGRDASSALRRPNERPHVEMSLRGDSVNEVRNIFSEIHVCCEMLTVLSGKDFHSHPAPCKDYIMSNGPTESRIALVTRSISIY